MIYVTVVKVDFLACVALSNCFTLTQSEISMGEVFEVYKSVFYRFEI